jgi:integrase/recombinase XerD
MSTTDKETDPIEEFHQQYVEKGRDHPKREVDGVRNTADSHARYLRKFRTWLQEHDKTLYDDVDFREVRQFRNWLRDEHGYSDGTVKNATGSVSQFFQIQRPTDTNPVEKWSEKGKKGKWSYTTEKERETRAKDGVVHLSKEQVTELIDHAPDPAFRSELILRLLVSTGIRRSELVTLRCGDVSPEERRINIYEKKTDDYRPVGFRSDKLARDLRMWLDHRRQREYGAEESKYLFPPGNAGAEKDHLSMATVGATVRKAADSAGIQETYTTDSDGRIRRKVTPHTLRATFAVHAAKAGVSAPIVRDALGHHSLSVTDIYTDLASGDAADVISRDGPSF